MDVVAVAQRSAMFTAWLPKVDLAFAAVEFMQLNGTAVTRLRRLPAGGVRRRLRELRRRPAARPASAARPRGQPRPASDRARVPAGELRHPRRCDRQPRRQPVCRRGGGGVRRGPFANYG